MTEKTITISEKTSLKVSSGLNTRPFLVLTIKEDFEETSVFLTEENTEDLIDGLEKILTTLFLKELKRDLKGRKPC